jgi:hypothetical protein
VKLGRRITLSVEPSRTCSTTAGEEGGRMRERNGEGGGREREMFGHSLDQNKRNNYA